MTAPAAHLPPAQPLAGLTVVELGHSVAAPVAGLILADLGARVVKIEQPGKGDDARSWGPPFWDGAATLFQTVNRNKLSAAVDLKDETQRAALVGFIVRQADIVVQNQRAGHARQDRPRRGGTDRGQAVAHLLQPRRVRRQGAAGVAGPAMIR